LTNIIPSVLASNEWRVFYSRQAPPYVDFSSKWIHSPVCRQKLSRPKAEKAGNTSRADDRFSEQEQSHRIFVRDASQITVGRLSAAGSELLKAPGKDLAHRKISAE
jgi:hypothetical protein